ncbi:hypothetical protein [Streptomyces cyanogenus]
MKNTCSPTHRDVKIPAPRRAVEAAAATGAGAAERIAAPGLRVLGDPALLSAVPERPAQAEVPDQQGPAEPRIVPEAAARALYGAPAAAASATPAPRVHRTPSKELPRVLGHRCPKRPRRR